MILPEEQRGKFAADQMQRHRERRRGPGVADERALGPTQICVFSQDLRAMNNGESTHSSGCVAVGGVRGGGGGAGAGAGAGEEGERIT